VGILLENILLEGLYLEGVPLEGLLWEWREKPFTTNKNLV
jgi:hypothetical protein